MRADTYTQSDVLSIEQSIVGHVEYTLARSRYKFDDQEAYQATSLSLRDRLIESWNDTQQYFKCARVCLWSLSVLQCGGADHTLPLSAAWPGNLKLAWKAVLPFDKGLQEETIASRGLAIPSTLSPCEYASHAARRDADPKRVYYLSMEFLMGRSLTNALNNLGVVNQYTEALREMGYSIEARPKSSGSPVPNPWLQLASRVQALGSVKKRKVCVSLIRSGGEMERAYGRQESRTPCTGCGGGSWRVAWRGKSFVRGAPQSRGPCFVYTRRCWRRRSVMQPWATAALAAWRRASWTPWPRWTCRPGATVSATSTACSARRAAGIVWPWLLCDCTVALHSSNKEMKAGVREIRLDLACGMFRTCTMLYTLHSILDA